MIVGQDFKTTALWLAIGLPLALALGRLMASVLYGGVALEYIVLFSFVLWLAVVALLSSDFPARRASQVNPLTALRQK